MWVVVVDTMGMGPNGQCYISVLFDLEANSSNKLVLGLLPASPSTWEVQNSDQNHRIFFHVYFPA